MTGPRAVWRVAAVQMTSTDDEARNRAAAERLAAEAVRRGADLIAFPENVAVLRREGEAVPGAEPLARGPLAWLRQIARRHGRYVLAGSVAERAPGGRKVFNTSVLLGPDGRRLAVYRKMHLFDVAIRGRAELRESATVRAGSRVAAADTPLGRLGLSICYDLRFPELYRRLALEGAQVIFVPSAFTSYTGRYHWLTLLRARAIENQCWIVAPAQWGRHHGRRRSFGHTAVIDPWGTVVAMREREEGIVTARIDLRRVAAVRRAMPCLRHVRRPLIGRGR